jgi:predicted dehydrogenase
MSLRSSIGVAFLGIGRMGETHLRNLLGISGVRVVVVADPRLEAAERGKALETLRLALAAKKSWMENRPVKVSEIQA